MTLSVVIITLNEQFYLPKLLEALSKQTYKDFEVIVVDGNSEDKTVFEAQKFLGSVQNLKIIEHERGISRQRNIGTKNASGQYLLFLDADVIPTPTFLEDLISCVKKYNLDAAISYLRPISKSKLTRISTFLGSFFLFNLISVFYKNTIGADFFVKREAFEKAGGFDEELNYAEDNDLYRKLLKQGAKYKVLYKPKIYMSLRRFKKDGYAKYILKTVLSMILISLFGVKKTQKIISFEFGKHINTNE